MVSTTAAAAAAAAQHDIHDDNDNDICGKAKEEQQQQQQQHEEEELQDAVASCGALVGECVLDSPQQAQTPSSSRCTNNNTKDVDLAAVSDRMTHHHQQHQQQQQQKHEQRQQHAATCNATNNSPPRNNRNTAATASSSFPPSVVNETSGNNINMAGVSAGIVAQGLAWVRNQREQRRRLYLAFQAQEQWRKIQQAQEAEHYHHHPTTTTAAASHHHHATAAAASNNNSGNANNITTTAAAAAAIHQKTSRNGSLLDNNPTFLTLVKHATTRRSNNSTTTPSPPVSGNSSSPSTTNNNNNSAHSSSPAQLRMRDRGDSRDGDDDDEVNDTLDNNRLMLLSPSGDGFSVEIRVSEEEDDGDDETPQKNHEDDDDDDLLLIPKVRIEEEEENCMREEDGDDDNDDEEGEKNSKLKQQHNVNPFILSPWQRQQIAMHVLPRGISYAKWKRLYSLARDGDSFEACLRLVKGFDKTLMVIRTTRGNQTFGGFADAAWQPPNNAGGVFTSTRFFGGSSACLYSFRQNSNSSASSNDNCSDNDNSNNNNNQKLEVYRWSGANRYIQLCDTNRRMLAFGGGGQDGLFGLAVQEDFQIGSTGHCATFDNEPLCDNGAHSHANDAFEIADVEIYGFLLELRDVTRLRPPPQLPFGIPYKSGVVPHHPAGTSRQLAVSFLVEHVVEGSFLLSPTHPPRYNLSFVCPCPRK